MDMHRIGRGLVAVAFGTTVMLGGQLAAMAPVALAGGAGTSGLSAGDGLWPNQSLVSADGSYRLTMQSDGNLVLYNRNNQPLWWTGTNGPLNTRHAEMQTDGNFVVYAAPRVALWQSRTGGHEGGLGYLSLQTDGNLVVLDGANQPLWSWRTGNLTPRHTGGNINDYETHAWGFRLWLNHKVAQDAYRSVRASGTLSSLALIGNSPLQLVSAVSPLLVTLGQIGCIGRFVNDIQRDDVGYGVAMDINWWSPFWSCNGSFKVWPQ